ncbi:MAG: hypothetical protein P4L03_03010 [Terracidiphilus sp.]|nr:hypothetical protein [Terracidiphilus sp.]
MMPLIQFGTCSNLSSSAFSITSGTSYQCLGPNITPSNASFDSFQIFGSHSQTIGNHSLRVGIDARQYRKYMTAYGNAAGVFKFATNFTSSSSSSTAAPIGQDLASFLLGLPTSGQFGKNAFAGLLPGTTLNGSTVATLQLLQPYPEFPNGGLALMNVNNGSSEYDSLNAHLERRFSSNYSMTASYTWSKWIEAISYLNSVTADRKYERRVSSSDRPQRFVMAATYKIPAGKGHWLDLRNAAANQAIGGWGLNLSFTAQSGTPVVWGNLQYYGGSMNWKSRQTTGTAFDTTQFNTSVSTQPVYNIRTFPSTNSAWRQDGLNNLDASMLKSFPLWKQSSIQLRAEAFNVLNHPTFGAPNVTPTNSAFGTVTSQWNSPRQLQFIARIRW